MQLSSLQYRVMLQKAVANYYLLNCKILSKEISAKERSFGIRFVV